MSCTQCCGIAQECDAATARKSLRRYRRRGPDRTTRLLIDGIRATLDGRAPHEATLLDVGAGVGVIHHELVGSLVERAVHVDASAATARRHVTRRRGEATRRRWSSSWATSSSSPLRWDTLTSSPWIV